MAESMQSIREFINMAKHHEQDLYQGNGPSNPSITTRLAIMEGAVEKLVNGQTWLLRLVASTLITAVVGMIVTLIKATH